jgi:hypothetical protein
MNQYVNNDMLVNARNEYVQYKVKTISIIDL